MTEKEMRERYENLRRSIITEAAALGMSATELKNAIASPWVDDYIPLVVERGGGVSAFPIHEPGTGDQNVSSTNTIREVSGQLSAEKLYGKSQTEANDHQATSDTSAFAKAVFEVAAPEAQVYVLWAGFTLADEQQEFLKSIEHYYLLRVKLTDSTWLIRTTDTADKICKNFKFDIRHWHNILVAPINLDTLAIRGPRSMGEIRKALGLEDEIDTRQVIA